MTKTIMSAVAAFELAYMLSGRALQDVETGTAGDQYRVEDCQDGFAAVAVYDDEGIVGYL